MSVENLMIKNSATPVVNVIGDLLSDIDDIRRLLKQHHKLLPTIFITVASGNFAQRSRIYAQFGG